MILWDMSSHLVSKYNSLLMEKQQLEKEIAELVKTLQLHESAAKGLKEEGLAKDVEAIEKDISAKKGRLEAVSKELEKIEQEMSARKDEIKKEIRERIYRSGLELIDSVVILQKRLEDLIEAIDRYEAAFKIYNDYITDAILVTAIIRDPDLLPKTKLGIGRSLELAFIINELKGTLSKFSDALNEALKKVVG